MQRNNLKTNLVVKFKEGYQSVSEKNLRSAKESQSHHLCHGTDRHRKVYLKTLDKNIKIPALESDRTVTKLMFIK